MAGIVMCAGLLSGCGEDPPEPSTLDDKQTTSQEPSSTPTPTSSLSAEEQDAVEAAKQAYDRWIDVASQLYKAPQNYTPSELSTRLYEVGGDPLANQMLDVLRSAKELEQALQGDRKVDQVTPEKVKVDVPEGDYPEVVLRACVDTSGIDLVSLDTGESVWPKDRQTKWVSYIKVWYYEGTWQVVEDRRRSEGEKC